jgi:hypothetical protein
MIQTHDHHRTQEESVIANMEETCKHIGASSLRLLKPSGQLKIRWGLVHPQKAAGTRGATHTFQGIDYTRKTPRGSTYKKYNYAAGIMTAASHQELGRTWDHTRNYRCAAVFTAGPNNGNRGRAAHSSQTRTIDPDVTDYSKFKECITDALVAMLREMKQLNVSAALIPGLSTGLYAGTHKSQIRSDFMVLIHNAIRRLGNMGSIREIVYCNT